MSTSAAADTVPLPQVNDTEEKGTKVHLIGTARSVWAAALIRVAAKMLRLAGRSLDRDHPVSIYLLNSTASRTITDAVESEGRMIRVCAQGLIVTVTATFVTALDLVML